MRFWKANKHNLREIADNFVEWALESHNWERDITWTAKPYTSSRSLSQNALAWQWFGEMAAHFSEKSGEIYSKEQMHDLMCHRFLGYRDVVIGHTVIPQQLIGTSQLDKAQFQRFLEQVDAWACDHGVMLTYPDISEYSKMREAQTA